MLEEMQLKAMESKTRNSIRSEASEARKHTVQRLPAALFAIALHLYKKGRHKESKLEAMCSIARQKEGG